MSDDISRQYQAKETGNVVPTEVACTVRTAIKDSKSRPDKSGLSKSYIDYPRRVHQVKHKENILRKDEE
jgi:hypothetical protein